MQLSSKHNCKTWSTRWPHKCTFITVRLL